MQTGSVWRDEEPKRIKNKKMQQKQRRKTPQTLKLHPPTHTPTQTGKVTWTLMCDEWRNNDASHNHQRDFPTTSLLLRKSFQRTDRRLNPLLQLLGGCFHFLSVCRDFLLFHRIISNLKRSSVTWSETTDPHTVTKGSHTHTHMHRWERRARWGWGGGQTAEGTNWF